MPISFATETDMQEEPEVHDLGSTSFQGKLLPWNGLKWTVFNILGLSYRYSSEKMEALPVE